MSQPEKSFRIGRVSASVFVNSAKSAEGNEREFRSVSLQRRYHTDQGWNSSSTFTLGDIPNALAVLEMAKAYVASIEATESAAMSEEFNESEPAL